MQTVTKLEALRTALGALRENGSSIALVPTMGALHEGHLALVREARAAADHVIVSIFVNPRQFGAGEDLDAYPRQLERDSALLAGEGVAVLWAPPAEEVYPPGYATNVSVSGVSGGLCGSDRPGHFDGVATVVLKLFNQVEPDMAFFGEKDWQQLAVIRRMARDLDLSHPRAEGIHGVAVVRDSDGLALSSRNAYLTPDQRRSAALLPQAMRSVAAAIARGAAVPAVLDELRDTLLAGGFDVIDYAELREGENLVPLDAVTGDARLFVAARIGGTRLIDNIAITG